MKVVDKIKRFGFPVFTKSNKVSLRYLKAHDKANKATLHKFGSRTAKAVNKIHCPHDELLGSHTKSGKIKDLPEFQRGLDLLLLITKDSSIR